MPAALKIEAAGPGTTIQDGGRFGLLRYGVTPAGPMDWVAFETANRALGNAAGAAAIEIGPGGISLTCDTPTILAYAGGRFIWTRGDGALPSAARVALRPGETLRAKGGLAKAGAWGAFAYCAVPGGIAVAPVMGSRATHVRAALGGLEGRSLRAGDVLRVAQDGCDLDDGTIAAPWLDRSDDPIRVVLGPQDDHFDAAALAVFGSATFTLTATADRMAYKFEGPRLDPAKDFNIVSDGIALGAIQIAGDGQPLVLMADRQPTGGYAKIAHVCRADIGRLAQMRPGDSCRFTPLDVDAAARALVVLEDRVAETTARINALRRMPTAASLIQANLISGVTNGDA